MKLKKLLSAPNQSSFLSRLTFLLPFILIGLTGAFGQNIVIDDVSANEGGDLVFTVTRLGVSLNPTNILYETNNGTATFADNDYVDNDNTVTIPAGIAASVIITVETVQDNFIESDETLVVDLVNSDNGTITDAQGIGTINNDDIGNVTIVATDDTAREQGLETGEYTVDLGGTNNTGSDVTINYILGGATTATEGTDFVALPGSITIPNGSDSGTILLTPLQDTEVEDYEIVRVVINSSSNPIAFPIDPDNADNRDDVIIEDNDLVDISINSPATQPEGNTGTATINFTVTIDQSHPTENVTVEYNISGGNEDGQTNTLTFLAGTVTLSQIVPVTTNGDFIVEPDEPVGIRLNNQSANALISVDEGTSSFIDDDIPGFTVTQSGGSTATSEPNVADNFTVVLDAQPSSNVVLNISSSDTGEGTVAPAALTFTPVNFGTPRTITVTGANDNIVDGPQPYTITISVNDASSDDAFDALPDQTVNVINADDDVAGVNVAPLSGTTTEIGGAANFTFTLDSEPIGDVTIPLTGYDTTEGIGAASVVLNAVNWQTGATVTVTGVDDNIDDGDVSYTINTGNVTAPSDPAYNALGGGAVPQLQVTNIDNDQATLTIFDAAIDEDGGSLNIVVQLDIPVTGGTTVSYSFIDGSAEGGDDYDDGDDGEEIDFDGDEAGEVQIITIPIIDDTELENSENFFIQLGTPTNGVLLSGSGQATATILDDDNCLPSPVLDASQPTNFCDAIDVDLNDYVSNTAPAGSELTWSRLPDQTNTSAYIESQVNAPGTYFGFFRDLDEDCFSPTISVTLVINTTPAIDSTAGSERCGEGMLTLTATAAADVTLNWYDVAIGGVILGTGSSFMTPSISETTSFFVEATANGCSSERVEVIATINEEPSVGTPVTTFACNVAGNGGPTVIDLDDALEGEDSGDWSITTDPSNGSIVIDSENNVDFEGLPDGDYIFTFTTNGAQAPCTDQSIDITITVNDCVVDTDGDGLTDGEEITLGTDPDDADTDDDGLTDGEEVLVADDPNTNAVPERASDPLDDCDPFFREGCDATPIDLAILKEVDNTIPLLNESITFTITLTNTSMDRAVSITVEDLISVDDGFEYVSHVASEGTYDEITGVWSVDELGVGEAVTLQITVVVIRAAVLVNTAVLTGSFPLDNNPDNNTSTVTVDVDRSDCVDCGTICNMFSPNGDNVNDLLILIDSRVQGSGCPDSPESDIQIFDRYGNSVFQMNNYDSSWDGTGQNGDLPKGTYFYVLDLGDGSEPVKGWIQIVR